MIFARNWRWMLALVFLLCGFVGFMSGVGATERDLADANPLTLLYYAMGLFILGGMDLGAPVGGPVWGQALTWMAYFGAPLLTTSALVEWLNVLVTNPTRWLRSMRGHTIIVGVNELSKGVMDRIKKAAPTSQIVVIERDIKKNVRQELEDRFDARCLAGEFTDEYFLQMLRIDRVHRVYLGGENDFDNFETASRLLEMRPDMGHKIMLHCNRLRYLREMEHSDVVKKTHTFNSYNLAARHLVQSVMLDHFRSTEKLDTVILSGFGIFGQTVLEELQEIAQDEIECIGIIDIDAHRRVMIAEEQVTLSPRIEKHVFQGEIGHPEVWQKVEQRIDLTTGAPLVLMVTGMDDENLRAGTWLRKRHPNARVLVRSQRASHFADSVSLTTGIHTFSLQKIFHDSIPSDWFG